MDILVFSFLDDIEEIISFEDIQEEYICFYSVVTFVCMLLIFYFQCGYGE
jgi:hypothetical protein